LYGQLLVVFGDVRSQLGGGSYGGWMVVMEKQFQSPEVSDFAPAMMRLYVAQQL
jgi:hypothetical protein